MTRLSALMRSSLCAAAALSLATFSAPAPAAAQAPAKITIVVFGFPSLGPFMPPVIKAKKLDAANGRLGMSIVGASDVRKQIEAVYKAGIDVGYLKAQPSGTTIYAKTLK